MAKCFWKKSKSLQKYFGFRIGSVLFVCPVYKTQSAPSFVHYWKQLISWPYWNVLLCLRHQIFTNLLFFKKFFWILSNWFWWGLWKLWKICSENIVWAVLTKFVVFLPLFTYFIFFKVTFLTSFSSKKRLELLTGYFIAAIKSYLGCIYF